MLPRSHPDEIGQSLYEVDHVSRVLDVVDEVAEQGDPFDILHDHCGFHCRGAGRPHSHTADPHAPWTIQPMPIRWNEPFGMVMVEALACGTPVIAFPEGAAPEIVQDKFNGYLVDDEESMARDRESRQD